MKSNKEVDSEIINQKAYKSMKSNTLNILPGDPQGSPDESLNFVLVFIDEAFLSKLSKYFGNGNYIKFDRVKFAELISRKENSSIKDIFLYTAPPFHTNNPTKEQILKKEGYDKFKQKLIDRNVIFKEGRCQRLRIDGEFVFNQKSVDILLSIDLVTTPTKYPDVKKVILVSNDSDFVPAIEFLNERKIKTILYGYYERKRNVPFSTSNELIKSVYKYQLIKKEDLEQCSLKK